MGDVISFDLAKEGEDRTGRALRGPAVCTHCGHKWQAVSPAGSHDGLECEKCGFYMGVLGAPVVPPEFWKCDCGSDLFFLTKQGATCRTCGLISTGWVDG